MEKEVYKGNIVRVTEQKIDHITWERIYLPDGVIVFRPDATTASRGPDLKPLERPGGFRRPETSRNTNGGVHSQP